MTKNKPKDFRIVVCPNKHKGRFYREAAELGKEEICGVCVEKVILVPEKLSTVKQSPKIRKGVK